MQGYWGRPERNAEVLRQSPLHKDYTDPVYGTGDIVRLGPGGHYLFVGRRDNLVKSRGYRIELGEIETALYRNPAILEAAALAIPDEEIGTRIVACVATAAGGPDAAAVRAACAELLPRYMVPEAIFTYAELPKTSTGKIDRQALVRVVVP
jgi:acyl-coenzyme A synthetase/AMP-(fatty) acid ligase